MFISSWSFKHLLWLTETFNSWGLKQVRSNQATSTPFQEQNRLRCLAVLMSFFFWRLSVSFHLFSIFFKISGLLLYELNEKKTNIFSITKPFLLLIFIYEVISNEHIWRHSLGVQEFCLWDRKVQSSKFIESRFQWLPGTVCIAREEQFRRTQPEVLISGFLPLLVRSRAPGSEPGLRGCSNPGSIAKRPAYKLHLSPPSTPESPTERAWEEATP